MNNTTIKFGASTVCFDSDMLDSLDLSAFQASAEDQNFLGRAPVSFKRIQSIDCVLKHYYRGGLVRHVSKRSYLYTGVQATRMWQEFALLQLLKSTELPVPRPLAVHCKRWLCFYQGDLITELIPDSQTLAECLKARALSQREWQALGQTLKRFHDLQVFHADLNANNILWQSCSATWHLIDFDKGKIMPNNGESAWKATNLTRLERSLNKIAAQQKQSDHPFHFTQSGWEQLNQAYNAGF